MIKNIFRAISIAACFGMMAFIFAANHNIPSEGNEIKIGLLTFLVILLCALIVWLGVSIFNDSD